jgi:hypothetical protein
VKIFLDTWVSIKKYKGNPDAEKLFKSAKTRFEAYTRILQ